MGSEGAAQLAFYVIGWIALLSLNTLIIPSPTSIWAITDRG
jgi:hypothetical protein